MQIDGNRRDQNAEYRREAELSEEAEKIITAEYFWPHVLVPGRRFEKNSVIMKARWLLMYFQSI